MSSEPKDPKNTPEKPEEAAATITDADFREAEFEEQVIHFWSKYRGLILGGVVGIFVIYLGYGLFGFLKDQHIEKVGQAYSAALAEENIEEFADDFESEPLGGLANLDLANEALEEKNFADAIRYYRSARRGLEGTPLYGRAWLGLGLSLVHDGQIDEGKNEFDGLSTSTDATPGFRSAAAYYAAFQYFAEGDLEAASERLDRLDAMEDPGFWSNEGSRLRDRIDRALAVNADAG